MPKSQKPRKKGKRSLDYATLRRHKKGEFNTPEARAKAFRNLERNQVHYRLGRGLVNRLVVLSSDSALTDGFLNSAFCLERWPTTRQRSDFSNVMSTLMLGAMCHKALNIAEAEYLKEIREAAYMSAMCVHMRMTGRSIPNENLDVVRIGLESAQNLMRFADEHDRDTFMRILAENELDYIQCHPEVIEPRKRYLFDRNYDIVEQWNSDGIAETLPPIKRKPKEEKMTNKRTLEDVHRDVIRPLLSRNDKYMAMDMKAEFAEMMTGFRRGLQKAALEYGIATMDEMPVPDAGELQTNKVSEDQMAECVAYARDKMGIDLFKIRYDDIGNEDSGEIVGYLFGTCYLDSAGKKRITIN